MVRKVGAWACWIQGKNLLVKKSGRVQGEVEDGNLCELIAIANALAILNRYRVLREQTLQLHTDSLVAISLIMEETIPKKPEFAVVVTYILNMLKQTKGYTIQHVKGHVWKGSDQEYSKPKYFINRWCDMAARKQLRMASDEVGYELYKKNRQAAIRRSKQRQRRKPHFTFSKSPRTGPYKRSAYPVRFEHF